MAIKFLNSLNADSGVLYVDADNNRVGIGTTSPTHTVEIGTDGGGEKILKMHSDVASSYFEIQSLGNVARLLATNNTNLLLQSDGSGGYITFNANSAERMRITPSGNVGIGTTSPSRKLHVDNSSGVGEAVISGTTGATLYFRPNTSYSVAGNFGIFTTGLTSGTYESTMDFKGYYNGVTTPLTIKGSGNVGIGTTNPNAKLHIGPDTLVSGYTPDRSTLAISDITNGGQLIIRGQSPRIWFDATAGGNAELFLDNSKLNILSGSPTLNGSSRLYIKADGNVGIGTTSPGQKLHVVGEGKIQGNLMVGASADVSGAAGQLHIKGPNAQVIILEDTDNANLVVRLSAEETVGFKIEDTTHSNVLFFGDQDGNVGIGTTSPSYKLDVSGEAKADAYRIDLSATTQRALSSTGTDSLQVGDAGVNDIKFKNASGTSFILNSTGNVGIGTTSPGSPLTVAGRVDFQNDLRLRGTDSAANQGVTRFYVDSSNKFYIDTANDGNNKFVIDSTGNVGIGTTSPGAKLDVNGGSANGLSITGANVGTEYVLHAKTSNGVSRLWVGGTGNIGIGTTTPSHKLQVAGNIYANAGQIYIDNGYYLSGGDATSRIYLGNNGSQGVQIYTNSTERMRIADGGNVGIGTTSPGEKLHVLGKALLNNGSSLYIDSSATQTVFANIVDIPMRFQTNSINRFTIGGTGVVTAHSDFIVNGNVGIGTTSPSDLLTVDGNARITGTLKVADGTYNSPSIAHRADEDTGIYFPENDIIAISTAAAERMRITSGGQLIVGGTTVGYAGTKLQVGNTSDSQNGLNILTSTTGYGYILFGDGPGADTYVGQITYKHGDNYMGFNTNGGEKVRITSAGNVGIGTTSPTSQLEVGDPNSAGTGITVAAQYNLSNAYLRFRSGHPGNASIWETASISATDDGNYNGRIHFRTSTNSQAAPTDKMVIKANGNVGIGTTSPDARLEVNTASTSDVAINANERLKILGNGTMSWGASNDYGQLSWDTGYALYRGQSGKGIKLQVNSSSTVMTLTTGGNVGIGTTSPSEKLHVVGDVRIEGDLTVNGSYTQIDTDVNTTEQWNVTNDGTGPAVTINQTGAQDIMDVQDDGTSVFYIEDGGNVGIGTTSPSEKLEVVGDIKVSADIHVGGDIVSTATSLYDLLPNISTTFTLTTTLVANTWTSVTTGNTDIPGSGTYAIQVYFNDNAVGGTGYAQTYSGTITWASSTSTNNAGYDAISEIPLHRSGHAANAQTIYLRTTERTTSSLELQIKSDRGHTADTDFVFKLIKLI